MFDITRDKDRITEAVWDAYSALKAAGHRPRICSPHHLKVDRFNFYPGRGTIIGDEETARPQRGLAAFIDLLAAIQSPGPRPSSTTAGSPAIPATANTTGLGLSLPKHF